jgi:uncharacterized protein YjiS (DUF1127 family)
MPDIGLPLPGLAGALVARLTTRIARFFGFMALAFQVRRERRHLLELNEHALKDLGLHGEAHAEAQRSFWDVPIERLCR